MPKTSQRRIGRPTKAPARGVKRIKLGLVVSADTKRKLDRAAESSGLSQSQEAERRIEAAFRYEVALGELDAANARVSEIATGNAEAALRRAGWASVLDPRYGGNVWLPPGRHNFPKGGWVDPKDQTPSQPLRFIPDPEFVNAIAQPIIETVKAALRKGRE